MGDFSCDVSNNSPRWGVIDLFWWKLAPAKFGGGIIYIQQFKDSWVKHNKTYIKTSATMHKLPPELLAGVCWIEVAGDPESIDRIAFEVRAFDWSGPKFVDDNLTITKKPEKTSFGPVSMQLRTAADTLGIDSTNMSGSDQRKLLRCLETDVFNIDLAAQHLKILAQHDNFHRLLPKLSKKQIRIIGARYNRGMGLSIDAIKKNTSYGDFIVKYWTKFSVLLQ